MLTASVRKTAEERRADVLKAAVPLFARGGLDGTSTDAVARAAGISQAYLFRLFPTKKELFITLIQHSFARVRDAFEAAAGDLSGEAALDALGEVYGELLRDRDELRLQMQAYVSSSDPEIGKVARREFGRLWRLIASISGADDEKLQGFVATGMLMNVVASMDAASHDSTWLKACVPPKWITAPTD